MKQPSWLKSLVIYEISTKAFTSPKGPGTGTFESLSSKLPYIKDLGVNGIWLTGHSLSNNNHFYNIWTQYACIDPSKLDPSLGSKQSFKKLIKKAHSLGIKMFLDVITHGVMSDSPLVKKFPHWFKGASWGMKDYDWFGKHQDLDDWWINLWLNYVKEFGVDGFRLDVATYRPDLWKIIRDKAYEFGHPIIIFPELGPGIDGVTDFIQLGDRMSDNIGRLKKSKMFSNVYSNTLRNITFEKIKGYKVKIEYNDNTYSLSNKNNKNKLKIKYLGTSKLKLVNKFYNQDKNILVNYTSLLVKNYKEKKIKNITVEHEENPEFHVGGKLNWQLKRENYLDFNLFFEKIKNNIQIKFPVRYDTSQLLSMQLSCHDNGWEGYKSDANPYESNLSRCIFGYSLLFAPYIPIFMSGEEFSADFKALPNLSPFLFGGKNPGKGKWLYGSCIDWKQRNIKEKFIMYEDVKKMLKIRRKLKRFIYPFKIAQKINNFVEVRFTSNIKIPKPYLYFDKKKIIIIAGNFNAHKKSIISFVIEFKKMNYKLSDKIKVQDLWSQTKFSVNYVKEFNKMTFSIPKDKIKNGGLLILQISKM